MRRLTLTGVMLAGAAATLCSVALAQSVFINEIHYDNVGPDSGERIEIIAPVFADLRGWKIVRYNGSSTPSMATVYAMPVATEETALEFLMPQFVAGGFKAIVVHYPQDGLQNGPSDGVALLDADGEVVQSLSYEGATAANIPPLPAPVLSQDIGVSETGSTPLEYSLQLSGTGTVYTDFVWMAEQPNTFGSANQGQTFVDPDAPLVSSTVPANGAIDVPPGASITVTFSEPVAVGFAPISAECAGRTFTASGGPSSFTLTPNALLPASTTCTITLAASEWTDLDGAQTPMAASYVFTFTTGIAQVVPAVPALGLVVLAALLAACAHVLSRRSY